MVQLSTTLDGSDSDFSGLIVKENIRRAFVRLIYMAGGLPPPKTGRIW